MLTALPPEQTEFMKKNFAQSMTGKPFSSLALDLWIECTMNKGSKLKAGWHSILKHEKQLLVDIRNVNNIGRIRACVQQHTNRKSRTRTHVECAPTRKRIDEEAVQDLVTCFEEFDCFPFDSTSPNLRTLQSGIQASDQLINDFKTAHQDGKTKLDKFMCDRVYSNKSSLHDRIGRSSRINFTKVPITKPSGEKLKVKTGEMERSAMAAVINLVEVSGKV